VTRADGRVGLDPIVAALARGDLWTLSLAGFLVRGGLVLLLLPIWPVPSPLDLADALGPAVTTAALGGPNPDLVRVVVIGSIVAATVIALAFAVGAAADVAAITTAADELVGRTSRFGGTVARGPGSRAVTAFLVRLVGLVPFAVALAATVPIVVGATYQELIDPTDLAIPVVIRVLSDVPGVVALLVATWLLGEAVGGIAVRLLVLEDRSVGGSLVGALALIVRRPIPALLTLVGTTLVFVVLLAPALVASALAWRFVVFELRSDSNAVAAALGVLGLAAVWLGALVLSGFAAAVRTVAWTSFALRGP
jgi:hypothetical protein